jgi:hypothetical protein
MDPTITPELIRSSRDDATVLVHHVDYILSSSARIEKTLANQTDFDALNEKQQKRWRLALFWFVDSFNDLKEKWDSITAPTGELLEWFEAAQPAETFMGRACASRIQFAHDLARDILDAPGITRWPSAESGDSELFHASFNPHDIASSDVKMIVAMATKIAKCAQYAKNDSRMLDKGIRVEAAKSLKRLASNILHQNHALATNEISEKEEYTDDHCPVELTGQHKPIWILGKDVPALTATKYAVIQTLINAYPHSVSKYDLEKKSGSPDAVNVLKRIRQSHTQWNKVIRLAGKPFGGYAIVRPTPKSTEVPH